MVLQLERVFFVTVPAEYFQHLDHTGNRVDRYERPELLYGAYEFTVTKEYCKVSSNHFTNFKNVLRKCFILVTCAG